MDVETVKNTGRKLEKFLARLSASDHACSHRDDDTIELMPLLCRQQVVDTLTNEGTNQGIGKFLLCRLLNVVLWRLSRDF